MESILNKMKLFLLSSSPLPSHPPFQFCWVGQVSHMAPGSCVFCMHISGSCD